MSVVQIFEDFSLENKLEFIFEKGAHDFSFSCGLDVAEDVSPNTLGAIPG